MAVDLSVSGKDRQAVGIETFYTDLHLAMHTLGDLDAAPFPSALEFREFLTAEFPRGMAGLRCLDAGCGGTAINSRTLAAAGADPSVAVDLNLNSLHAVRQSLTGQAQRVISLAGGSLLDMPFADATFDFSVCSGVVHHTPDPERALRELRRVLKPTGRFYVSVYCFDRSAMLLGVRLLRLAARVIPFSFLHPLFKHSTILNNFVLDHMYVPILWVYRADEFTRLLNQCGFRVEQSFVSALDTLPKWRLGSWSLTGDGLLRIFVCKPLTDGVSE